MKGIIDYLRNRPQVLWWIGAALAIPAFFINLGLFPLHGDEATRATVSYEMTLSGNYWVPTIAGDFYYNKPPLFNWIMILFMDLFGRADEWVFRLTSVLPLFGMALTLFWWLRKQLDTRIAVIAAFATMTFGSMLARDSMLGHIDIFYSWVTLGSFIAIHHFFQRQQWLLLFSVSYSLAAIGFMSKGLPSVVFQGFTLIGLFAVERKFWKLFSWQHILGGSIFLAVVAGYFYIYDQYNDWEKLVEVFWDQSRQRTATDKPWYESLVHLFVFPGDQLLHLMPWSLLAVFCFRKGYLKSLWKQPFTRFLLVVFAVNIPVYWISPDTRPRYLFMLYPILLTVFVQAYYQNGSQLPRIKRVLEYIFLGVFILIGLGVFGAFFAELPPIDLLAVKVVAIALAFAAIVGLHLSLPKQRLMVIVLALLVLRTGFDWFIIPQREATSKYSRYKAVSIEAGKRSLGQPLHIYSGVSVNHENIFYIERERGEILDLQRPDTPEKRQHLYLGRDVTLMEQDKEYEVLYEFQIRFEDRIIQMMKFSPEPLPVVPN